MDIFKPFLGYNYFNKFEKSNNFSRLVCPCNFEVFYEDASLIYSKNENNIFNIKDDVSPKDRFKSWVDTSVVVASKVPSFYIYEMSYKMSGFNYVLTGVVGALKLPGLGEDYLTSCEDCLSEEVEEQFEFLKNSDFYSSPVCALYEEDEDFKFLNIIKATMSSSYMFKAKQNNVLHKIWKVFEPEAVEVFKNYFKDKKYFLVCGTKKYEAAIKYKEFAGGSGEGSSDYIMAFLFSKSDFNFTALPVHRLVSGINMFDSESMLNKVSEYFDVRSCKTLDSMRNVMFNFKRQNEIAFGFYADDRYGVFSLRDVGAVKNFFEEYTSYEQLDVVVLNKIILQSILNISPGCISYSCLDSAASLAVDSGDACFAIFLNGLRSSEFFELVKGGKKLPPRSFSFFPKPVEGLLFYLLG